MYQVNTRPYYDTINQCYKQILEIYPKPCGPLSKIIKQVSPSPLSPFRQFSDCDPYPRCIYAIMNPENYCDFLRINELPLLLCFLTYNGYQIDNQITKIMMKANTEIKDTLLFYIIESKKS